MAVSRAERTDQLERLLADLTSLRARARISVPKWGVEAPA